MKDYPDYTTIGFALLAVVLMFSLFLLTGCETTMMEERLKLEQERTKQIQLHSEQADKQREFDRHKFDERVRLCEKFATEHHIPSDRSGISCGLGQ